MTDEPRHVGGESRSVRSRLGNVRWTLLSRLTMAAASLLLVAVLSLNLGAEEFGVYSGVVSLVAILGAVARMGAAEVMLEDLARRPDEQSRAFGRALATTTVAAVVGVAVALVLGLVILPSVPVSFIVTMAVGEFFFVVGNDITQRFLHAHERFREAAVAAILAIGARLLAVGSLIVYPLLSITDLGFRFLVSGLVAWGIGLRAVVAVAGRPTLNLPNSVSEVRRGLEISVGATSHLVSSRVDQTLLLRAGLDQQAGIYGLASRVIANAMLPALALRSVFYPDHFREGAKGTSHAIALARRLAKPLAGYSALVFVGVLVIAPVLERLLPDSFEDVRWVLMLMGLLPLLRLIQALVSDVLTVTGFHELKSRVTVGGALCNVAMNLALIPIWGWRGALAATYTTEVCLLLIFGYFVRVNASKEAAS